MVLPATPLAFSHTPHGRGTHSQPKPNRLNLPVRIEARKLHQLEIMFY